MAATGDDMTALCVNVGGDERRGGASYSVADDDDTVDDVVAGGMLLVGAEVVGVGVSRDSCDSERLGGCGLSDEEEESSAGGSGISGESGRGGDGFAATTSSSSSSSSSSTSANIGGTLHITSHQTHSQHRWFVVWLHCFDERRRRTRCNCHAGRQSTWRRWTSVG